MCPSVHNKNTRKLSSGGDVIVEVIGVLVEISGVIVEVSECYICRKAGEEMQLMTSNSSRGIKKKLTLLL